MTAKSKRVWTFIVLAIFLVGTYGVYILFMLPGVGTPPTTTVTTREDLKDKILIFHSEDCPHCKQLIADFKTNKVEDIIKNISWLEVNDKKENQYNISLYISKVQECKLGEDSYVIPFAYDKGQCYVGGDKIEEYIYGIAGITIETTTTTKGN